MNVFTTVQLHSEGHNDRLIRTELETGDLTRLRRGGYTSERPPTSEQRHRLLLESTRDRLGTATVVSHTSAALLHGWPVPPASLDRVTCTREREPTGGGNVSSWLHAYAGALPDDAVTEIDGFRVTSPARTAADASRLLPRDDAVAMLDAALRLSRSGENEALRLAVTEQLRADARKHGARRARLALGLASGLAESPVESRSRLAFHDHGIPEPVLQFRVIDAFGRVVAITDFAWPDHGVVGEVDGRVKYESLLRPGERASDALVREKRRENDIQALGWVVFRWFPDDLANPAVLCSRLRRLLDGRMTRIG